MAYTVEKSDRRFEIVEKNTGLVVSVHKKERPARSQCRSLNLGAGFAGFTPTFFALKQKEKATT